jgi:Cdc6-like AAA superfamily ATPase
MCLEKLVNITSVHRNRATSDFFLGSSQGFNATIMAYGPTGSGKTYTMEGPSQTREGDEADGIIHRVFRDLHDETQGSSHSQVLLF